jgi:hypothetical protein
MELVNIVDKTLSNLVTLLMLLESRTCRQHMGISFQFDWHAWACPLRYERSIGDKNYRVACQWKYIPFTS